MADQYDGLDFTPEAGAGAAGTPPASMAGLDFEPERPAPAKTQDAGGGLDFERETAPAPQPSIDDVDRMGRLYPEEMTRAILTDTFGEQKVERFRGRGLQGGAMDAKDTRPPLSEAELPEFRKFQRTEMDLARRFAPESPMAQGLNWAEKMGHAAGEAIAEGAQRDMRQEFYKGYEAERMNTLTNFGLGAAPPAAGTAAGVAVARMLAGRALARVPYIGPIVTVGSAIAAGIGAERAVGAGIDAAAPGARETPAGQAGAIAGIAVPGAAGLANLLRAGAVVKNTEGLGAAAKFVAQRAGTTAAAGAGIDWATHEGLKAMGVEDGTYTPTRALTAAILSTGLAHLDFSVRGLKGIEVADVYDTVNREAATGAKPGTTIDSETGKPVNSKADVEVWKAVNERLAAMKAKGDKFVMDPEKFRLNVWQQLQGGQPVGRTRATVVGGAVEPAAGRGAPGLDFEPETPAGAAPVPAPAPTEGDFLAKSGEGVSAAAREAGIVPGAQTVVFGTKGTELPAVYAWAPSAAVQTSHSGEMMAPNPSYKLTNTRDYSAPEERDKQLAVLRNFDPRRHVTDAGDASLGPSMVATVIDEDGQASLQRLGGNNRGYAIQNLPPEKRGALRQLENEKAAQFGLEPNKSPDAELVRYLGTFDFRQPGERARAQAIVDVLNPAPGMVQGPAKRAELDAATVPADELTTTPDGGRYTMDIAPTAAQDLINGLIARGRADRNLTASIAANPSSAQDYAQRLMLNAAYRQPAVAEARMDARSASTPVRGLVDAAVPALIQIRAQGSEDIADAIARAYSTTLGYLDSKGGNLPAALERAAAQTELTPGHDVTQAIAGGLRRAVVLGKAGRIDTEASVDNARAMFNRMAAAVQQRDPNQGMLFGGTETVGDVVRRALGIDNGQGGSTLREDEQLYFPYSGGAPKTPQQAAKGRALPSGGGKNRDLSGLHGRAAREEDRADILARLSRGEKIDPAELHAALVAGRPMTAVLRDGVNWDLGFSVVGATVETPLDFATLNLALRSPYRESVRIAAIVKGKVVASAVLHMGSINESVASAQTALAWLNGTKVPKGAKVYLSHNHPSGDPTPSQNDAVVTKRFRETVEAAGYEWADHIITNGDRYFSFRGMDIEKFPVRVRAPWELVPREKLGKMENAAAWSQLAGTLRTGDPDAIHVVYLTTKLGVTAIERMPVEFPDSLGARIIAGAGREGGRFVLVSFPRSTWADNSAAVQQFVASMKLRAPEIDVHDVATPARPSAKADHVLEGAPMESAGLANVREEDDLRAEIHAEPNYSPLRAVDERGNPYAPVKLAGLPGIKIVEMPELVQLVRDLTGSIPEIRRLRRARGQMIPLGKGRIRLDARIFADPISAAKTLAHELGHVIDWLPNQALGRGNLWGRLHALRNYLKERWTPNGPKAKELRSELIALSQMWKPYDPQNDPPAYVKYRESGVELYADFISVMFNSPALAKQVAPTFWKEFWAAVPHAKAEVHDAINGIQQWLTQPMATRLQQRSAKVDTMFAIGAEIFERKFQERQERYRGFRGFMSRLKQAFFDQYAPVRDRARQAGDWDTQALFDGHPLARNDHWRWLEQLQRNVTQPLEAADFTLDDLGRYLFYDRIVNENYPLSAAMAAKMGHATGGRSVIANPQGHTPATARLGLLQMRLEAGGNPADLAARARGRSRVAILEDGVRKFHNAVLDVMREAHEVGLLTDGQMNLINANSQHYAAFVPLEYVDSFVPSGVYHQAGTFKEISSPFLSTVLKVLTMQRAIQMQRLKVATVNLLQRSFAAEIEPATTRKSADGRTERPVPPRERSQGQIMLREGGKPAWYNVPREVALMFDHTPTPLLEATLDLLRVPFQKFFYPLFITYNPVFQLATNPIRDFRRTNINRPAGVGFWSLVRQLPIIKQIGKNPALDAARALVDRAKVEPLIAEMLDNLAIMPGDATFATTAGVVDSAFDRILQEHGHLPADEQSKWLPKNLPLIGPVLRAIERAGKINELLPKVAVYRQLRILGWNPKDAALYVRSYVGTPNFGRRGKHVSIANTIYPFFNIWTKGWAADAELARRGFQRNSHPGKKGVSASAWWLRQTAFSFVPKLLHIAAKIGIMGWGIKRLMDGIGNYDRKNYDVVPLGYAGASDVNPEGKVAYLRIPKDPTDRVLTGLFGNIVESLATKAAKAGAFGSEIAKWNAGGDDSIATALTQNFSIAANDVPGVNPLIKLGSGWSQYLSGQNPYDDFYGRHILSDAQQDARGLPALEQMMQWSLDQSGAQHFVRLNGNNTTTEIVVANAPAAQGLVKLSDSGYLQAQSDAKQQEAAKHAQEKLALNSDVQKLATEYFHLRDLGKAVRMPAQEVRYQQLHGWYQAVYEPGMEAIGVIDDAPSKARLRQNIERQSEPYKRQ